MELALCPVTRSRWREPITDMVRYAKRFPPMATLLSRFPIEVAEQAEILLKYEPYIDREQKMAEKIKIFKTMIMSPILTPTFLLK